MQNAVLPIRLLEDVGFQDMFGPSRSDGTKDPSEEYGALLLSDERIEIPGL
jgi:hypothetical protein